MQPCVFHLKCACAATTLTPSDGREYTSRKVRIAEPGHAGRDTRIHQGSDVTGVDGMAEALVA